ncbi:hypothetical protein JQ582_40790 [Bradyrhizobium japonicum]|uniref:hypothetical protein n=1 Tax=Bradyrhizobium japonicum TaxID=375 RepID=UPI001BA86A17|nr:hypothetical protein [Bradyrhizobium japonicum]MBR0750257.1 hypothetical protein [Bradyrhizobium japonicum]
MAKANGDHTPARAAVTIEFEFFAYSEPQWDRIKVAVDRLGLDADQIEREISPVIRTTLRSSIEFVVSQYSPTRLQPRPAELRALRNDIEKLRVSIIDALFVEVELVGRPASFARRLLPAVDGDMETATRDYFAKLVRNLDRMIEQAGQRGGNARKTARDQCWSELLAIWCDLGGKPRGRAAAAFLWVASKPVMGDAIPAHKSIAKWLERRLSTP